MPPRAAEFAIGDPQQPYLFLLLDHPLDLVILDGGEFGGRDLVTGALFAGLLQRLRTQQAADMVGSKWRLGAFHFFHSLFNLSGALRGSEPESSDERCVFLSEFR